MLCKNCQAEMQLSDNVLLSNPPKYQYVCRFCGNIETLESVLISKPSYKLDWTKVKDFNELLLLLNEVDLHVTASHPKYDELKQFSF